MNENVFVIPFLFFLEHKRMRCELKQRQRRTVLEHHSGRVYIGRGVFNHNSATSRGGEKPMMRVNVILFLSRALCEWVSPAVYFLKLSYHALSGYFLPWQTKHSSAHTPKKKTNNNNDCGGGIINKHTHSAYVLCNHQSLACSLWTAMPCLKPVWMTVVFANH